MAKKLHSTFIPRLFIALVVVLSGLAMVPYFGLSSEALGWQNFIGVYHCEEDCLRSAVLQMAYRDNGNDYTIGIGAKIVDEDGNDTQARVTIRVELPNGNTVTAQKITDEDGIVIFTGDTTMTGTYTTTIINIERPGYTFDDHNSDLTESLTVP